MSKKINDFTRHYYKECDFNCCESTLWSCNDAWDLGLPQEAFKLSSGFGGGCCNGDLCGAVAGGIMALGSTFTNERAHVSPEMRKRAKMLMQTVEERLGGCRCDYLKAHYRDDEVGCLAVVQKIADIIDEIKDAELPEE